MAKAATKKPAGKAAKPETGNAKAADMRAKTDDQLGDQLADQLRTYIDRMVDRRHAA